MFNVGVSGYFALIRKRNKVSELIEHLKCNDEIDSEKVNNDPPSPNDAMKALEKIGIPAVEALTQLAIRKLGHYSSSYAIEILGRIRHAEAASGLLRIMDAIKDSEYIADQVIFSLQNLEVNAIEPVLAYAATARRDNDEWKWLGAMEGIYHNRDSRIVDELLLSISSGFAFDIEFTLSVLGDQGDKRAIDYLVTMLQDDFFSEEAKTALQQLLSPSEYRATLERLGM